MLRRSARSLAAVAVAACTAVLVAACGPASTSPSAAHSSPPSVATTQATPAASTTPPPSPAPGHSSAATAAAGTAACSTSDLRVTAATSYAASGSQALFGTAGGTYVPIDFFNIYSSAPCTLYGYPGVSFVGSPAGSQVGPQIGPAASRRSPPAPATVTLAPGGGAHAFLLISNVTTTACQPMTTAHMLRVYPPGQYSAAYVKFSARVCSGHVSHGNLSVTAVQAGAARRGQAPPAG